MYDISSLFSTSEFSKIQNDVYNDWIAFPSSDPTDSSFVQQLESKYGITLSGQLYYIYDKAGDLSPLNPVVDFSNPNANVVAKVTGDIPSPDGSSNIDWQEMTGVSGQLATTIFQVSTQGGQQIEASVTVVFPDLQRQRTTKCGPFSVTLQTPFLPPSIPHRCVSVQLMPKCTLTINLIYPHLLGLFGSQV